MRKALKSLWLVLPLVAACRTHTTEPKLSPVASASAEEIEALIEQLAIAQEPAGDAPILTPRRDAPKTDPRMIAMEAGRKLGDYGQAAFPYLLKHLDDNRQSVAFRRVLPSTVGDACFCIMRGQLIPLPSDYEMSIMREGADGQLHERPLYAGRDIFDPGTIAAWLEARRYGSLEEMQVETLQWVIDEEKKIGFRNEKDKQDYLHPLERQLDRVQASTQPMP